MMFFCRLIVVGVVLAVSSGRPADSKNDGTLEECLKQESDIYFLLDSSSSLMRRDFQKLRDFAVTLVQKLDVDREATRIGLGVFSDDFYPEFDLGDHSNKSSLISAISRVRYRGGGTYTSRGLLGMRTQGFRERVVRENATKIGVVVTDGKSRHRTDTLAEAALLRDLGVWLFAVGVGRGVDREELSIFASHPHTEFLRHVTSFTDLSPLTSDLALAACRLLPPHADNATCGLDQKADILFVFNAAAMTSSNVSHVQEFTENIIKEFSMTSGNVRVGVVSEGRQGGDIALSQYIRRQDFVEALKKQPRSQLASLLKKVRLQGYEPRFGGRPKAKKFAIVFVDDVNVSIDAMVEARMMTYSDVIVYVIGLGLSDQKDKVKQLPSSAENYSEFRSYAALLSPEGDWERKEFVRKLCSHL